MVGNHLINFLKGWRDERGGGMTADKGQMFGRFACRGHSFCSTMVVFLLLLEKVRHFIDNVGIGIKSRLARAQQKRSRKSY